MLLTKALASCLLLSGNVLQVSAGSVEAAIEAIGNLQRRSHRLDDSLNQNAIEILDRLHRRQTATAASASASGSAPNPSVTPQSGDASQININAWEEKTAKACSAAIGALNGGASNPSGMAVCYNLPFLDNSTGVFEAELRMYNVSPPIDPWVGVTAKDVSMSMSYLGATVQSADQSLLKRTEIFNIEDITVPKWKIWRRQSTTAQQLKVMKFVGQINSNLIGSAMDAASLKPLLIPVITLSATNPSTGQAVNTTLSSTEASFVSGVFENKSANRTTDATLASATAAVASSAPFVVPGRTFGVFPIGMIVTLAWVVGFAAAVGFGTFERIRFRDQYRRRVQREGGIGVARI